MRLDQMLVEQKLASSKSKAQALIDGGYVCVNGAVSTKASKAVCESDSIEMTGAEHPWVSRGGMKLADALAQFKVNVSGLVALDIGASTGGFTDVLRQNGAAKIYAVDVGTDQLHDSLKANAHVISIEQTNAKDLTSELIPDAIDMIVCDASFISLAKVLPAALALAKPEAQLIALIKPQFEVGKDRLGKGGVVKDAALHKEVCEQAGEWIAAAGWQVNDIAPSPILGPKGNKEFLLWAHKGV